MIQTRWWIALGLGLALLVVLVGVLAWPRRDPNPAPRFAFHAGDRRVGFSVDGQSFFASTPTTTTLWDLTSDRMTSKATTHQLSLASVAYNRDRSRFVAWSIADQAVVWGDTATEEIRTKYPVKLAPNVLLPNLAWAEGDRRIELIAFDDTTQPKLLEVRTWVVATGTETMRTIQGPGTAFVGPIAYSPGNLVWAYYDSVRDAWQLWDAGADRPIGGPLRTPTTRRNVASQGVDGAAFTPDGQTLIAGRGDGQVECWDVATGSVRQTIRLFPSNHAVRFVRVSPDAQILAATGLVYPTTNWSGWIWSQIRRWTTGRALYEADHTVLLTDLATAQPLARLSGVDFGQFSLDSQLFLTSDLKDVYAIRVMPTRSGRRSQSSPAPQPVGKSP